MEQGDVVPIGTEGRNHAEKLERVIDPSGDVPNLRHTHEITRTELKATCHTPT